MLYKTSQPTILLFGNPTVERNSKEICIGDHLSIALPIGLQVGILFKVLYCRVTRGPSVA